MKSLNYVRYAFITAAACMFATSSDAAWIYTETNTVVNGVSHGYITDNVWTFYASRAKNSTDELTVDASKGMSIDPAQPAKIDFSEVEGGYKVVKFVGVRNTSSPLVLYTTEFIAPHCTNLSGQEIFYPGNNTYNTTLTKIQLREDVAVTLGNDRMFCNCTSLSSFSPRKIANKTLNTDMFLGCSALEGEFEFSECTEFRGSAFNGCSKIGGIKAENAVSIGQSSFAGCSSLSNIVLSSAVATVGSSAFSGCSKITTEFVQGILNKGLTQLGNLSSPVACFKNCSGLMGTLVWNCPNVTVIPKECFSGCSSLERVEIKSYVSEIQTSAFFNLKGGAEIYLYKMPVETYVAASIASAEAPFPRVNISGDMEVWLEKMYGDTKNHLIRKSEFGDTSWVSKHRDDVTWGKNMGVKVKSDTTMYEDGKVKDKNVVAFIMGNTNNGCWILKKPKDGLRVIVR